MRAYEARIRPTHGRPGVGGAAGVALFTATTAAPAAVIAVGLASEGGDAISWPGAIVWGVVATVAFTAFSLMGKGIGMTQIDLLDLLGSVAASPGSSAATALGAVIHHMNGAILAISWAFAVALVDLPANWATGLGWGAILTVLALLMMSAMRAVHPAIRRGEQQDPGPAATNFGAMTPLGSLMGHLVFGAVLGLTYDAWPLD